MAAPVVLSPPKLIGTDTVETVLGVSIDRIRRLIRREDPRVMAGYLGKISGRHIWNAHELFAGLYSSPDALWAEIRRVETGNRDLRFCAVEGCGKPSHFVRLCRDHLRTLMKTWRRAEHSTLVVWQLLAMCTWVVERNAHLVPPTGWDPWSGTCMTPHCHDDTVGHGPLCRSCLDEFWGHTPS